MAPYLRNYFQTETLSIAASYPPTSYIHLPSRLKNSKPDFMSDTITISAADVNKLRQQTGAGMMDCRKALQESGGDFEKAIDYLRAKGQKVAANRSDREAKEGVAIARTNPDGTYGVVLLLSSETDFVAKNADFIQFANNIATIA